jgi:hypothetical protein
MLDRPAHARRAFLRVGVTLFLGLTAIAAAVARPATPGVVHLSPGPNLDRQTSAARLVGRRETTELALAILSNAEVLSP